MEQIFVRGSRLNPRFVGKIQCSSPLKFHTEEYNLIGPECLISGYDLDDFQREILVEGYDAKDRRYPLTIKIENNYLVVDGLNSMISRNSWTEMTSLEMYAVMQPRTGRRKLFFAGQNVVVEPSCSNCGNNLGLIKYEL